MTLYKAGYFVNLQKSNFHPTQQIQFLGLIVESKSCRFSVPQAKVDKLITFITKILSENMCTLKDLEKCVGKCRNMSIAVPPAKLYTHAHNTKHFQKIFPTAYPHDKHGKN